MDAHHILAIPVPLSGHMIPMLNLCCKLVSMGCRKITFLINNDKMELLQELQKQLEDNGDLETGVISADSLPAALPPAFTGGDDQIQRLSDEAEAMSDPARVAAVRVAKESSIPVSYVLADVGLGWAQDTANEIGVPRIALSILALAELAIGVHMPTLIAEGSYNPLRDEKPASEVLIHVPGLPALRASEIPQVSQYPKSNKVYWSYLLRQYGRAKEAKAILVNSCNDLEKDAYDAVLAHHGLPLHFVGPLVTPLAKNQPRSECLEWLDAKEPGSVIYISFGSFLKWTSSELEEILIGIKESGYKFLLAFRTDVLLDEPSPTLEKFLLSFSGNKNSSSTMQGFIVPWAPQVEILNHPSTGGFFTHYGWNSTSESISAGVPMIGKPVLGDQFVMRKLAIEKWKIAVNIEEDTNGRISKAAVKHALTKLMQDTEIKDNAARLKACIRRAVSEGGDSYKCLQQLSRIL